MVPRPSASGSSARRRRSRSAIRISLVPAAFDSRGAGCRPHDGCRAVGYRGHVVLIETCVAARPSADIDAVTTTWRPIPISSREAGLHFVAAQCRTRVAGFRWTSTSATEGSEGAQMTGGDPGRDWRSQPPLSGWAVVGAITSVLVDRSMETTVPLTVDTWVPGRVRNQPTTPAVASIPVSATASRMRWLI